MSLSGPKALMIVSGARESPNDVAQIPKLPPSLPLSCTSSAEFEAVLKSTDTAILRNILGIKTYPVQSKGIKVDGRRAVIRLGCLL